MNSSSQNDRIAKMTFASVYTHYVTKVEKKGRSKQELHEVIEWLTGYNSKKLDELMKQKVTGEKSSVIRQRVERSHQLQLGRQGKTNSRLSVKEIDQHCALDTASEILLKQAINRLNLSARAYHRILKVARTIADLAGVEKINNQHIAEAIQYRRLDKQ